MDTPDGCIALSLPDQYITRLRREGPQEMTIRAEVWPDPSQDVWIESLTIEAPGIGRRDVVLGLCPDFYLLVGDYDVQIH